MSLVRPTVVDRLWKPGDGVEPTNEFIEDDTATVSDDESFMESSTPPGGRTLSAASRCAASATDDCGR